MPLDPITGEARIETDTGPLKDLVAALRDLQSSTEAVGSALDKLEGPGKDAAKSTQELGEEGKKTGANIVELNQALEVMGKVSRRASEFLRTATSDLYEFSGAMGQVATLTPEVASQLDSMSQKTLQLSQDIGVDATEAANTFYQAISSGAAGDAVGGLELTEVAMKAAVAGATDAKIAVDGLSTVLNAWGIQASESMRVSDIFFKTVALGKTTMGELSASMFQAAPVASSMGISFEEVAAAVATLTKTGTPTSVAMTQIRAVLIAMQKELPEMKAALDHLGVEGFEGLMEKGGSLQGALALLRQASDETGIKLVKMTGRVEGANAVLGVTGKMAATAASDLEQISNATGSTEEAYEVMAGTFKVQSDFLKVQVKAVYLEFATALQETLVPAMQAVVGVLSTLLDHWRELSPGTRAAIAAVVGLVAALAPLGTAIVMTKVALVGLQVLLPGVSTGFAGLSAAMLATGIGAFVVAVGLLTKGFIDLKAANAEAMASAQEAGGSWGDYHHALTQAEERAGTLAKVAAYLSHGLAMEETRVAEATKAWLEHTIGVDKAVLTSDAYQKRSAELFRQMKDGTVSAVEYRREMLRVADAESVAAGMGRVLSESQQAQAQGFRDSIAATLEQQGVLVGATAEEERYQTALKNVSDAMAAKTITEQEAINSIRNIVVSSQEAAAAEERHARATALVEGSLQSYSSEMTSFLGAGSEWTADQAEMAEAVEKSWEKLSKGVGGVLQQMWDDRRGLDEKLEEARQKDAEAVAAANSKLAEAEKAHADKLVTLNEKLGQSKSDAAWNSTARQIEAENEKFQKILETTQSVGGQNVAKVEEQYARQVEANREALAQMIVDHVNSMVLLGQISDETAKAIFSSLRSAYPDVEVFSPVADAHAELMGTLRDATDESSESQVESINSIPAALENVVAGMEERVGDFEAASADWGTAIDDLAARKESAAQSIIVMDQSMVESAAKAGQVLLAEDLAMGESAEARQSTIEGAVEGESAARAQGAQEAENAGRRIRDDSKQTADTVASDAASVEASTGRMSGGYKMAADEIAGSSQRISTQAAEAGLRIGKSYTDLFPILDGAVDVLGDTTKAVEGTTEAVKKAGRDQGRGYGDASESVEEHADIAADSLASVRAELDSTGEGVLDYADVFREVPTEVETDIVIAGVDETIEQVAALQTAFRHLGGKVTITVEGSYAPKDPPVDFGSPDLRLYYALERIQEKADEGFSLLGAVDPGTDSLLGEENGHLRWYMLLREFLDLAGDTTAINAWQDAWRSIFEGGSAEEGSIAWYLSEWRDYELGKPADFGSYLPDYEPPDLSSLSEDPKEAMRQWKRLYDDLKAAEDERYRKRMDNLKHQESTTEKDFERTKWQNAIRTEEDQHEYFMKQLDERSLGLKRFYEDWKVYEQEVREAQREAQREIKEAWKLEQEQADAVSDNVRTLLDEMEVQINQRYDAEIAAIDDLLQAEDSRHTATMEHYADEIGALQDYIDEQEDGLRQMGLAFEVWQDGLGLSDLKAGLSDVNDALRQLPTGRESSGRGRGKAKPEDMVRARVTDLQRRVLQDLLATGTLSEHQARMAGIAVQQGELRLDELRALLEQAQDQVKGTIGALEEEQRIRKEAIDDAQLKWKLEREGINKQLEALGELEEAEKSRHDDEVARLEGRQEVIESNREKDLAHVDRMVELEEQRHLARMRQLEEEYALQLLIAEGLSEDEAAAQIAAVHRRAQEAMEQAQKIIEQMAESIDDLVDAPVKVPYEFTPAPVPGGGIPIVGVPTDPIPIPVQLIVSPGETAIPATPGVPGGGGEENLSMEELQALWDKAQKFAGYRGFHAAGFKAWVRKWFPNLYKLYFEDGLGEEAGGADDTGPFGDLVVGAGKAGKAVKDLFTDPLKTDLEELIRLAEQLGMTIGDLPPGLIGQPIVPPGGGLPPPSIPGPTPPPITTFSDMMGVVPEMPMSRRALTGSGVVNDVDNVFQNYGTIIISDDAEETAQLLRERLGEGW